MYLINIISLLNYQTKCQNQWGVGGGGGVSIKCSLKYYILRQQKVLV